VIDRERVTESHGKDRPSPHRTHGPTASTDSSVAKGVLTPATVLSLHESVGNAPVAGMLRDKIGGTAEGGTLGPKNVQREKLQHTGPGKPPIKTVSGVNAIRALKVLETAQPFTYAGGALGPVTLIPGIAIDGRILLYASPLTVYYLDGQSVYEAYAPDFVRDIWLTAFAQGAANAAWLVPLAKAEFALIEGLIAPWYLMLAFPSSRGSSLFTSTWTTSSCSSTIIRPW
jgi:hypothetical protein